MSYFKVNFIKIVLIGLEIDLDFFYNCVLI